MLPDSNGVSPAPPYLGTLAPCSISFRIQDYYLLWSVFPDCSAKRCLHGPGQPSPKAPQPHDKSWFRLFRFRSPLLTESHLISFPPGTKMFQFPGCASVPYEFRYGLSVITDRVAPFGNPRIKAWLTAPRGLSQPPTSFIAYFSQGIHTIR